MAGPEDEREEQAEDLFEDLDKFFAPIRDPDWPEGEEAAEPGATTRVEGALEGWPGPEVSIPEEAELAPAGPEGPASPGEEPDEAPAATGEGDAGAEASIEEEEEAPKDADEGPDADVWAGDRDDEWEELRSALDEEGVALGEPGATEMDEVASPADEAPDEEAVEAAAEHFAESMRQTPEDVERELLADLDETPPGPETIRVEPIAEEPEAPPPSWVEPATQVPAEEGEAPPPPPTGRNLPAAFVSGGLLLATALTVLAINKGAFAFLAAGIILLGQGELYAVLKRRGGQPATALGLAVGALMVAGAYLRGEAAVLFTVFLAMALSVLWFMAAPPRARRGSVAGVGATLLGVVYVPLMASFVLVMLRAEGDVGRNLMLTVVGLTVLYDVCAYAIGSLWGSRSLAPTISPKKSWEGAVGATFVLLLVALAIVPSVEPFTAATAVGLALVIAVTAPIGDLVESALKRDLGVKDMGSILPGHGGILDRVDSILLTAPAAWYFLRLVVL